MTGGDLSAVEMRPRGPGGRRTAFLAADLADRTTAARRALRHCDLCALECGVNRAADEVGACGLGARAFWFREELHWGLEEDLVPAHRIHVAGCNLRCSFCSARGWVDRPQRARSWDVLELADHVARRYARGAACVSFVGGEPTVNLPAILDLLARLERVPKVVWETNAFLSERSMDLLRDVVNVYLADFKFGNDECARRFAGLDGYVATVMRGLRYAARESELIVRHLLIPGHFRCCFKPLIDRLRRDLPGARVAVWGGYLAPVGSGSGPSARGTISRDDVRRAIDVVESAGLEPVEAGHG